MAIYTAVENVRLDSLGHYIPDSPGSLSCEYTDISYNVMNGTMYAHIWGKTVNTTICSGHNMTYYEDYYDTYGVNNISSFKEEVSDMFPLGDVIDCTVISTCAFFRPFRYPDYDPIWITFQIVVYVLFSVGSIMWIFHCTHGYMFFKRAEFTLLNQT